MKTERLMRMEVGSKLKNSRMKAGMTQEFVSEQIGVSRQTISNWENNKSYPDIVSVINLSDLYSVSLDELLKEDKNMINHLKESTDTVRSREKFSKVIQIVAYLVIWVASILAFWFGIDPDGAVYSLAVFFLILPVTTFVISLLIGKDNSWSKYKWLMVLFFGAMYMAADYATFSLLNNIVFDKVNIPDFEMIAVGGLISAVGMVIGMLASSAKKKKLAKADK